MSRLHEDEDRCGGIVLDAVGLSRFSSLYLSYKYIIHNTTNHSECSDIHFWL